MFIVRLPSIFFMLALLCYYVPKILNKPHPFYRKAHIVTGGLSAVTMVLAMCLQIGTPKFGRYMALTLVLGIITLTGILLPKKGKFMRKLHLLSTISFFIVLFGSIFLGRIMK